MNKRIASIFAIAATAVVVQSASAGFVVPSTATELATTSGINTPLRNAPRTYEAYYAANQFPGTAQTINGMQLRLAIGENWRPVGYVGSSWPDAPITFSSFTITLAQPTAGLVSDGEYLSTTPTFASYEVAPVVVYSGPLTIPAGAFTADGGLTGIHSFGPTIPFTTPYNLAAGTGLVFQLNLSGYGATGTPLQAFFGSTGFLNGSYDAISSTASGTATVPNGFSSPLFVNFTTVVPESSAMLPLAAAGLVLSRRRRA